jgi:hypothetical protein
MQIHFLSVFDEETCAMCGADRPPGEATANTNWVSCCEQQFNVES